MLKRITIRKLQGDRGEVVPFPETFAQFQQVAAETCGYTSSRLPWLHFTVNGGSVRANNYQLIRDRDIVDVEFEHPKANIQTADKHNTTSSQSKRVSSSQSNGISSSKKRKSSGKHEPEEEPDSNPDLDEGGDGDRDQDYIEGKRPARRASSRALKKIHAVTASQNYVEVDEEDAPLVEDKKKHKRAKRSSASNPSYSYAQSHSQSSSSSPALIRPPMKNRSAYWFFSQQFAKELAHQGDSLTTISQQAGTMWKELTPEEKQKFLTMAIEDKVRYETEQAAWETRNGSETKTASTTTPTTTTTTTANTTTTTQSPQPPPEEPKKICTTLGCGKVALLGPCPNCAELGLPPAYFCSQACFETGWQQHALKHVAPAMAPVQ